MINEQIYIKIKKVLNHFILNRGSGSTKAAINGVDNIPNALLLVDGNNEWYRNFVEEKNKVVNISSLNTAIGKAVVIDNGFIMKLFDEITTDELYFEDLYVLKNRIAETDPWWVKKYQNGIVMFKIQSNVLSDSINYVITKMVKVDDRELPYFVDILTNEVFDYRRATSQHKVEFMFLPSKTEKFIHITTKDSYKNSNDAI